MGITRIIAILLILGGIAAFVFQGSLIYRSRQTVFEAGSVKITAPSVHEVDITPWVGGGAVAVGGVLLVVSFMRRS